MDNPNQDTTPVDDIDVDVSDVDLDTESDVVDSTGTSTSERPASKADSNPQSDASTPPSANFDLTKIPKELRPQVEEALKAKDLEWKRTFTRTTQEASARTKQLESEAAALKNTVATYERLAHEVASDPTKLEAYRKLRGYDNASPVRKDPEPPASFETVDDLINFVDRKYSTKIAELEQQLLRKTTQTIQAKEQEVRWDGALNELRKDQRFQKYENLITRMAMSEGKYKQVYTGNNETEVLKTAYEDFVALLSDDMKAAQQELIVNLKKKKNSSTVVPRKSVLTDSAVNASSKDDIIARVQQRLGTPL